MASKGGDDLAGAIAEAKAALGEAGAMGFGGKNKGGRSSSSSSSLSSSRSVSPSDDGGDGGGEDALVASALLEEGRGQSGAGPSPPANEAPTCKSALPSSSADVGVPVVVGEAALREALAAERLVTSVLREENAALRASVEALTALLATAEAALAQQRGAVSGGSANAHSSPLVAGPANSSVVAAAAAGGPKPKTMASLFAGRKAPANPSQPSPPPPAPAAAAPAQQQQEPPYHHAAADHERRKAELMRQLAADDALTAARGGPEDPFVTEARKKHFVVDARSQGISAVGFGNAPNPRGYLGAGWGGGGSGGGLGARGPTASMEGDASEVNEAMRRAVEDGVMDDRRAVLEADEDAKLAARLRRLQTRGK